MSKRILSAVLAIMAATAFVATGAEARVEASGSNSGYSQKASKSGKAVSTKSSKRYATSKAYKKKRYSKAGYGKKRYASTGRKTRLTKRSVTSYASSGGGGGSSRSCLQPAARALLNRIEGQFGAVSIISTCRSGATIAGTGKPSKHRYGLAVDFDAGGRKGAIVRWLVANHHSGGTMTYRDMSHIHIDVGARFVSLGANSRRG